MVLRQASVSLASAQKPALHEATLRQSNAAKPGSKQTVTIEAGGLRERRHDNALHPLFLLGGAPCFAQYSALALKAEQTACSGLKLRTCCWRG